MAFQVRTETYPTADGLDGRVLVLEETGGAARAEVWPARGLNCYRWQARQGEQALDLIYTAPNFFLGGRATSCGTPILFPFPNRIRDGRFRWDGKDYELPKNDSAHVNAIHGFVFDRPWRVVDQGADGDGAWVTGEFHSSADAPQFGASWPADWRIRVTHRLRAASLHIRAEVSNPDSRPLPFGLGYHPYFRVPPVPNSPAADCTVQGNARQLWELQGSLPTGERRRPEGVLDLTVPRALEALQLDHVYTDVEAPPVGDLRVLGVLRQPSYRVAVRVLAAPAFRELVLYTPPHRQAVCLEPYTCTTDAINLEQRGVDAGWRVLAPGQTWTAEVACEVVREEGTT
jgi:aldose 1-epimerase